MHSQPGYDFLLSQLELLRRRIFFAKAERIDTQQLEIEFAETKAKLDLLAKDPCADDLTEGASDNDNDTSSGDDYGRPARIKKKSKGRRDIRLLDIPEERVEILDSALEGKAERIGFEESCLFGRRRGGTIRIVMARATYKITSDDETTTFVTADKPKAIYERGILAPSFIAHLLTKKFRWGMPFHRVALELASEGIALDDSTMCRYAEHVGATLGCSKRTGPISLPSSAMSGGNASRDLCSTSSSPGPRVSSSACAPCAAPSPPPSATPSHSAMRCADSSTTADSAWRTTRVSAR